MSYVVSADIDLRTRNLTSVIREIQTGLGNVRGNIDVSVSSTAQRNINATSRSIQATRKNLSQVKDEARKAADSIESFGKASALAIRRFTAFTVVTTGFIGLSRTIRQSIDDAIDFQREVVKISQVTGKTVSGLKALTDEIGRLSTTLGVSSSELLLASRTLSQTGLAARDVERSLQAIARSDLSPTFDNIVDTTEGSIAIFRQFGVEANQLEAKLSSINSVSKKFAIESADIITAVRRAGGAFAASGGDFEQFIALMTSVRSTTRESAESIATGFRTIFTRLQRTRTQNFLGDLGIDLRDVEGQFIGPYQAVAKLSTALQSLPGTDPRFAQIIEELGGFRQVTKVIPLIKEYGTAQKALVVAQGETNSLAEDASTAQESLAIRIRKVREEFEELIRTVAGSDSFKLITDTIVGLTSAVIRLSDALVPLLPAITALAGFGTIKFAKRFFSGKDAFIQNFVNPGGPQKFNTGGMVPGVGNSDTVPALLTPGEFVLTKKAVEKAGVGNLRNFNNAAKFNKGGLVGKYASGGLVGNLSTNTKVAGGAIAFELLSSFDKLGDTSKQLAETIGSLGIQFVLMNTAAKNSVTATKDRTAVEEATTNLRGSIQTNRTAKDIYSGSNQELLDAEKELAEITKQRIEADKKAPKRGDVTRQGHRLRSFDSPDKRFLNTLPDRQFSDFRLGQRPELDDIPERVKKQGLFSVLNKGRDPAKLVKDRGLSRVLDRPFEGETQVGQAGQVSVKPVDDKALKEAVSLRKQELEVMNRVNKLQQKTVTSERQLNNTVAERVKARNKLRVSRGKQFLNDNLASAAIGTSLALSGAGSLVTRSAQKDIASGGTSTTKAGVGGALSGAATGAQLGALAGPVGAAIGGVIFGIAGFTSSLNEAASQIKQIDLANSVKEVSNTLDAISKGRTTAQEGVFGLNLRVQSLRSSQLAASGSPEDAQNVRAEIRNILPDLRVFLSELAKGSTTFDQFNRQAGDLSRFFAREQGISLSDLNKEIIDQIKIQNDAKVINQEILTQRAREAQRLRELGVLTAAVANSFRQLGKVQSNIGNQSAISSGQVLPSSFVNQLAGFGDLSNITDIGGFESAAADFGKLFGNAGQALASEVTQAAKVAKELPSILESLKSDVDTGFSPEGEFVARLEDRLEDVPDFIRKSIIAKAKEIVGPEGRDATLITAVAKDSNAVSKQLTSSIEQIGQILEDAGDELNKRKNAFTDGVKNIQANIDAANRFRFKAAEIEQQRLSAQFNGSRDLTLGEKNTEFERKLDILTQGGPRTVSTIQGALNGQDGARQRLVDARDRLQNLRAGGANGADVEAAAEGFKNANLEVVRLTSSLKFLADSTIKVKNAQDELSKIQSQREVNKSLLQTLVSGKPQDQAALSKQVSATTQLIKLQQSGNLSQAPKALIQAAQPFINQFKDAQFGGIQLSELNNQILESALPPELKQFIRPDVKELDTKAELDRALEEQQKANLALANNTQTSIDKMVTELRGLFSTFINDIKNAFGQVEQDQQKRAAEDEANRKKTLEIAADRNKNLANNLGIRPDQLPQAQAIQPQLSEIRSLEERERGLRSIQRGDNPFQRTPIDEAVSGLGSGTRNVNTIDTVFDNISKKLESAGFTQAEIGQVRNKFNEGVGARIAGDEVVTQEDVANSINSIIAKIVRDGLETTGTQLSTQSQSLLDNTAFTGPQLRNILSAPSSQQQQLSRFDPQQAKEIADERRRSSTVVSKAAGDPTPAIGPDSTILRNTNQFLNNLNQGVQERGQFRVTNIQSQAGGNNAVSGPSGIDAASIKVISDSSATQKESAEKFEKAAENFKGSVDVIPANIGLDGTVSVEVSINGGEVLSTLQPQFEQLIESKIARSIDLLIDNDRIGADSLPRIRPRNITNPAK